MNRGLSSATEGTKRRVRRKGVFPQDRGKTIPKGDHCRRGFTKSCSPAERDANPSRALEAIRQPFELTHPDEETRNKKAVCHYRRKSSPETANTD